MNSLLPGRGFPARQTFGFSRLIVGVSVLHLFDPLHVEVDNNLFLSHC
ncbi:mCG1051088 [Mus musculus]|nr:mCG1051088 [Mus musculus]